MLSIYVFEDHAIIALSGRTFSNCLAIVPVEDNINLSKYDYVEYKGKMIKVYIPNVRGDLK